MGKLERCTMQEELDLDGGAVRLYEGSRGFNGSMWVQYRV